MVTKHNVKNISQKLGFWRMMGFGLTEPDHGSNPGGM
jgi:alkylation response protein AidB-like acyl-CoA dehydrogenase